MTTLSAGAVPLSPGQAHHLVNVVRIFKKRRGGRRRIATLRSGVCSVAAREQLQRRAFRRARFVLDTAAQQS
jgi:hypothetical protein